MFLASSLNDKLKKTMKEVDPQSIQTCFFPYEKPPPNPAVIIVHKHDENNELDSNQLDNLTDKEWQRTFSIPKLHNKWKEKLKLNFNPLYKKISDNVMSEKVKKAKLFIKDSVDPDNLELKKNKRWNISVNPKEKVRPELRKTIFEATHKLNNYKLVPLKEKNNIEEGVDSRNYMYINGEKWENSNLFEDYEKKYLNTISGENAFENTKRYWKKYAYDRFNENVLPISNERKHFEEPRYFKKYMTPLQETNFKLKTMKKVKEITSLEREKVIKKILHENPGNEKFFEKINSLTNKEMAQTYQEKFNELTGKSKNLTQKNFKKSWKDEELIDKVKTLNNWNNIKWFKPYKEKEDLNDKSFNKRELLKPLVTKGSQIVKEEDKIKAKLEEEYKKQIKKHLLEKRKTIFYSEPVSTTNSLLESKYPLDKKTYDLQIQKSIEDRKTYKKNKSEDNIHKINEDNDDDLIIQDKNALISIIQPYSTKYFLQAYKTVTLDDLKEKKRKRNNDRFFEYKYSHFGTYREFEFSEKNYIDFEVGTFKLKKEKIKAWSCCMNTDEFSKGCRKIRINKLKWNLDSA
jgi:hypothetical protein